MASLARLSARLASRRTPGAAVRGFRTASRCCAAQNFTMPALSPTMTEGNIAKWNVKEGDAFSAGDVLLEIETDKATMDVEAQEDGILVKIMQSDGSKSVQVGTRIGVIAEPGDDISALEIPPDESAPSQKPDAAAASTPKPPGSEAAASESANPSSSGGDGAATRTAGDGSIPKQTYPLLPSVAQLVAENGLDEATVGKIVPTGPNGRLLKGDVLAFLGSVPAERPAAISDRFQKLGHLDLSNVKVAEKKAAAPSSSPPPKTTEPPSSEAEHEVGELEVAVPVSLAKVVEVQKKIQDTLGVFMPLSTFIARAAEVANDDLPPSRTSKLSANDLFDQVLGLDKIHNPKGSRGFYLPQVAALPHASMLAAKTFGAPPARRDIIDILAGPPPKKAAQPSVTVVPGMSTGTNVFSLVVPPGDETRATIFLERVKVILEKEPGRLVL